MTKKEKSKHDRAFEFLLELTRRLGFVSDEAEAKLQEVVTLIVDDPRNQEAAKECIRCGSDLEGEWCSDETCPFSDWRQNNPIGFSGSEFDPCPEEDDYKITPEDMAKHFPLVDWAYSDRREDEDEDEEVETADGEGFFDGDDPGEAYCEKCGAAIAEDDDQVYVSNTTYCARCAPKTVTCKLCEEPCLAASAHLHQGEYIGDECCWDDRLKATE